MTTTENFKHKMLLNTISDCILINHLGIATDKTLFTSFENLCYLLDIDYYEIEPILFKQLEQSIQRVKLDTFNTNTELVEQLMNHAEILLKEINILVEIYN